ncbi:MAG: hypothetical protein NW207_01020 [Cytophagales bacterium]|nr:hypothetical protein [Cytophagales bacterium]
MDTLEEVKEILKRVALQQEAREKSQSRIDVQLLELKQAQLKTDAQLAKTDAQLAKTDAQLAKTDAQLAKTDLKLKETSQILSSIGINLGHTAEEFFFYSLESNPKIGNITFDHVEANIKSKVKNIQDEFDIVLYNGDSIGLVEIKHKVHPNDIEKLVTNKVQNFRLLFPVYKDYNIYLGIGGMSIPSEVADMAHTKGIAVLRQKGDLMLIEDNYMKVY